MKKRKIYCSKLMKAGPRYPGFTDASEGDERIISAQFSCLKTGKAVGPDNYVARPDLCNSSRVCYRGR